jgi:hypothetical protein
LNTQSNNGLQLQVFADAFKQEVNVRFMNATDGISTVSLQKVDGSFLFKRKIRGKKNEASSRNFKCKKLKMGARYRFVYSNSTQQVEQWIHVH